MNQEDNVQVIIFDNEKIENSSLDITYNVTYKYNSSLKKRVYICHIICDKLVKVSNYYEVLFTQGIIIDRIIAEDPKVSIVSSILFTIFEFRGGVKFMPDTAMHLKGIDFKEKVETEKNITLGGVVGIVYDSNPKKYKDSFIKAAEFFTRDYHIKVASNFDEAINIINNAYIPAFKS